MQSAPSQNKETSSICVTVPVEEESELHVSTTTDFGGNKKRTAYPIIRHTDIPEKNKSDILETIMSAVEKFGRNYDLACRQIKDDLDRFYGPHWHAIVGESFGYEVTHQTYHIIYLFFLGKLGILVWKNNK